MLSALPLCMLQPSDTNAFDDQQSVAGSVNSPASNVKAGQAAEEQQEEA
jgi:hypothetical protein